MKPNFEKFLLEADQEDFVEIQSGVCLYTAKYLIREQKHWSWGDGEESKNFDFSTSPYWLTTNDGVKPIGIDNADDLAEILN